jgi:hypothetical protein
MTHPRLAMLATRFATTENTGRNWPLLSGAVASPREARRTLATYFTTMVSALLQPSAQELDVYQDAARLPERERRSQLTVAGRRSSVPDYPGGNIASALPVTPGGLGVVEVALVGITAGLDTPQQNRGARRARLPDRELRAAPASRSAGLPPPAGEPDRR